MLSVAITLGSAIILALLSASWTATAASSSRLLSTTQP